MNNKIDIDHLISRRVLPMPRTAQKSDVLRRWLRRIRRHCKKWSEPTDATAIFNLHFKVHSFSRQSFHADATLEIPIDDKTMVYTSITAGSKTECAALKLVIQKIETSDWFTEMKAKGIYFRITGAGMEQLYKGYL